MVVGLSIVLESSNKGTRTTTTNKNHPQVINKTTTIKPYYPPRNSSSPPLTAAGFLDHCFLCKQKLLPAKDIYMYKGDRGFCSVECRCRQILMDEEESLNVYKRDNCSLAAMKAPPTSSSSSSSSSSSAPSATSRNCKGTRNRANGFAY